MQKNGLANIINTYVYTYIYYRPYELCRRQLLSCVETTPPLLSGKKGAYDNSWVVCNDSRESVNLQRQISELPEELAAEGGIEIHQSAADPKDDMEFYLNVATSDSNGNLLINFFATEMAEQY